METSVPKLELRDIHKSFLGVKVLDDVGFTVEKGTVHVIMGENGAGKSTLMKIIDGLVPQDSGQILIDGKEVAIRNTQAAQELGIAMIFQELNYFPDLTVEENIFMSRLPSGKLPGTVGWRNIRKQAEAFIKQENLQFEPTTAMRDLSVSDIQMLEILKAVSFNAQIILMDEPTSAISIREANILFQKIYELRNRGISILYITHKLDEVFRIADKITVLRDGKVIESKPAEEYTENMLIRDMVGREIKDIYPKEKIPIGDIAFEVKNLSVDGILSDINLYARKGEILGISGLVGAGRTELARAIFGMDPISEGQILLDNKDVTPKNIITSMKKGVTMLTEDRRNYGIISIRSVRENISLANLSLSKNALINHKKERAETEEYSQRLKVKTTTIETPVETLSGGNQQKVILAKWLMIDTKVMIMDEPTRGIDVGAKSEIYKIMMDLCKNGTIVIMISSELPELLGMTDRLYVMRQGRVIGELTRDEYDQERIMKYASGGK